MALKRRNWVQPSDVARYFHVTASTVSQWLADGKLRCAHLPTGHVRILARDVMRWLLHEGKQIPDELGDLGAKQILVLDADRDSAEAMASALRGAGGCKVIVAATPAEAKGFLNGALPDLVVLKVARPGSNGNGSSGMVILGGGVPEPAGNGSPAPEMAIRVNDILAAPVDMGVLVSRVAHALLS